MRVRGRVRGVQGGGSRIGLWNESFSYAQRPPIHKRQRQVDQTVRVSKEVTR